MIRKRHLEFSFHTPGPFRANALRVAGLAAFVLTLVVSAQPANAFHRTYIEPYVGGGLRDFIDVIVREHSVLAVDQGYFGPILKEDLQAREKVLFAESSGVIALVITNKRILAASTGSTEWEELVIGVHESLPISVHLGLGVAMVATDRRVIGITEGRRHFVSRQLAVREDIVDSLHDADIAVLVTDKRLIALSPITGTFSEEDVSLREKIERIAIGFDYATVTTNRRIVVFRAPRGTWISKRY